MAKKRVNRVWGLKRWRKIGKMTQAKAAAVIGVSLRTYRNWESGAFAPSLLASARLKQITKGKK